MWRDKRAAINKNRRTSENFLILMAIAGGSAGIFLGMKAPVYHKSAKPLFRFGVPFIVILQILMIFYLYFPS